MEALLPVSGPHLNLQTWCTWGARWVQPWCSLDTGHGAPTEHRLAELCQARTDAHPISKAPEMRLSLVLPCLRSCNALVCCHRADCGKVACRSMPGGSAFKRSAARAGAMGLNASDDDARTQDRLGSRQTCCDAAAGLSIGPAVDHGVAIGAGVDGAAIPPATTTGGVGHPIGPIGSGRGKPTARGRGRAATRGGAGGSTMLTCTHQHS